MTSPPAPASPEHGRAGRNLPAAAAVGFGLGALVVVALFFVPVAWPVLVTVVMLLGIHELSVVLANTGRRIQRLPLFIGTVVMVPGAWWFGPLFLVSAFALTVLAGFAFRIRHGARGFVADGTAQAFVTAYVPLLGSFAAMLPHVDGDGAWWAFAFVATVVGSDIGGYASGVLFGRHPMAPTISPKKSWEGFAGSVVLSVAAGSVVVGLGTSLPWWCGTILGAAVVVTATYGDLVESMLKRDLGVKDMGTLLPGHGGIMDRLDSLLPSAVVSYAVITAQLWLATHL